MSTRTTLTIWLCLWAAGPVWAADAATTEGKLDAVTVYRGQALVTRLVDVPGPPGLRELVVTQLPNRILPGSLFAESADGVEVRSVRYRERPVQQDVRDEVRAIDDEIREVEDKLQANQRYTELTAEHKMHLDKLEQFVAPTATVELSQGVLNADTLRELSTYLCEQRAKIADDELKLSHEQRALNEQLDLLRRRRNELTGGTARTVREAVVFVNLTKAEGRLQLRYLVESATWYPSYNVRADADRNHVTLEYNASIQQMSGENWNDVTMTLSTATPTLAARAPALNPLTLRLTAPMEQQQQQAGGKGYAEAQRELIQKKAQLENRRNFELVIEGNEARAAAQLQQAPQSAVQTLDLDFGLNALAGDLQVLDLQNRGRVDRSRKPSFDTSEGISVTYSLDGRTNLPSRSDQQLIQIASLPLEAEFYKVAPAVLTNYVYNEATVTNSGDRVLLAGPVSSFWSGEFVGQGQIPSVAVGETFPVGFGIDTSLRTSRELVEKTEKAQGGNRVASFTYRVAVENFGAAPAAIRLLDRLPNTRESEVKVTLTDPGRELSDEPTYQKTLRKKGILRWDVEVPPLAIGLKAEAIEYAFQLEYDRQMSIAALPLASQ